MLGPHAVVVRCDDSDSFHKLANTNIIVCILKKYPGIHCEASVQSKPSQHGRGPNTTKSRDCQRRRTPLLVIAENVLRLLNEFIPIRVSPCLQRLEFERMHEFHFKKEALHGRGKLSLLSIGSSRIVLTQLLLLLSLLRSRAYQGTVLHATTGGTAFTRFDQACQLDLFHQVLDHAILFGSQHFSEKLPTRIFRVSSFLASQLQGVYQGL